MLAGNFVLCYFECCNRFVISTTILVLFCWQSFISSTFLCIWYDGAHICLEDRKVDAVIKGNNNNNQTTTKKNKYSTLIKGKNKMCCEPLPMKPYQYLHKYILARIMIYVAMWLVNKTDIKTHTRLNNNYRSMNTTWSTKEKKEKEKEKPNGADRG